MQIVNCVQREYDWFQAHIGVCSGSHAADIIAYLKNGDEAADRKNYKALKVAEILTGMYDETNYVSKAMEWGIATEPAARAAYALEESVFVETVGYVIGAVPRMICSPDGLVGDKGIVGFKCPKTSTHIKWMLEGVLPPEHLPQAVFELAVCEDRDWFDFVSYDPRLPKRYQMFTIRLERREANTIAMEEAVLKFNREVDELIARMDEIAPPVPEDAPAQPQGEGWLTDEDIATLGRPGE